LACEVERVAGRLPVLMRIREVPAYEVSFNSVDVLIETKLPAVDRAVLSLVSAQRWASIDDVRAYLGLGHDVSHITVRRMLQEEMLEEVAAKAEARPSVFARVLNLFKGDSTYEPPRA